MHIHSIIKQNCNAQDLKTLANAIHELGPASSYKNMTRESFHNEVLAPLENIYTSVYKLLSETGNDLEKREIANILSTFTMEVFQEFFPSLDAYTMFLGKIKQDKQWMKEITQRSYAHPIGFKKLILAELRPKSESGTRQPPSLQLRLHDYTTAKEEQPAESKDDVEKSSMWEREFQHHHRFDMYSHILRGSAFDYRYYEYQEADVRNITDTYGLDLPKNVTPDKFLEGRAKADRFVTFEKFDKTIHVKPKDEKKLKEESERLKRENLFLGREFSEPRGPKISPYLDAAKIDVSKAPRIPTKGEKGSLVLEKRKETVAVLHGHSAMITGLRYHPLAQSHFISQDVNNPMITMCLLFIDPAKNKEPSYLLKKHDPTSISERTDPVPSIPSNLAGLFDEIIEKIRQSKQLRSDLDYLVENFERYVGQTNLNQLDEIQTMEFFKENFSDKAFKAAKKNRLGQFDSPTKFWSTEDEKENSESLKELRESEKQLSLLNLRKIYEELTGRKFNVKEFYEFMQPSLISIRSKKVEPRRGL